MFDKAVDIFKSGKTLKLVEKFNPTKSEWGSHIQLLSSAAIATTGDILEMGTGDFSTPMLHDIVASSSPPRMLVSSDTDLGWLFKFASKRSEYHQLVGVPVYDDGAHCGRWQGGFPVLDQDSLEIVGNTDRHLTSNKQIDCPKM